MNQSPDRQCPHCKAGVGLARAVSTIPGRLDVVSVKVVCECCKTEWIVEEAEDPPPYFAEKRPTN
jgi:hypothetical protein